MGLDLEQRLLWIPSLWQSARAQPATIDSAQTTSLNFLREHDIFDTRTDFDSNHFQLPKPALLASQVVQRAVVEAKLMNQIS